MNHVFLIGRLTRDPEFKKTPNDISVCTFSIAVNRRFANAAGDREADFLNIVTWRGLADICSKYLSKGSKVAVTGEIRTRNYANQQGEKRYVTEIQADDIEFLNSKNNGSSESMPEVPEGFTPLDEESELPF